MAGFRLDGITDRIGDLLPAATVGAAKGYAEQQALGAPQGTAPTTTRVILDAALALFGGSVSGPWGQALTFAGGLGLGEDALGYAQSKGYLKKTTASSALVRRANLVQPLPPQPGAPVRPYRYQSAEEVA